MKFSSATVIGCLTTLASATWSYDDAPKQQGSPKVIPYGTGAAAQSTPCTTDATAPNQTPRPDSAPGKKTHKVEVGALGQLIFSPNQVEAAVGDVIEFNFRALNHTLTQSSFESPCKKNDGFDSGFMFNPKNETGVFRSYVTVKDTKPMWFYCKQPNPASHCGRGMVFGINPAGKMNEFIKNAEKQGASAPGPAPAPGTAPASTPTATPGDSYGTPADSYDTPADSYGTPADSYGTPANAAPTTTVTVGLENGKVLKFEPEYLQNQKKGTVIRFDFRAINHTLTESSFDNPCKKLDGTKIDTNFMNVNKEDIPNAKPFDLVLDSDADKPRWFYCKQANGQPNGHCANGMVFAINPKKGQFEEFKKKAAATLPKIKGRGLELGQMW